MSLIRKKIPRAKKNIHERSSMITKMKLNSMNTTATRKSKLSLACSLIYTPEIHVKDNFFPTTNYKKDTEKKDIKKEISCEFFSQD